MKIFVKAKPGAQEERIIKKDESQDLFGQNRPAENIYEVWVKEPPIQGRANIAIAKALASYFKVPNSQIKLVSGFSSKQKIFEITP